MTPDPALVTDRTSFLVFLDDLRIFLEDNEDDYGSVNTTGTGILEGMHGGIVANDLSSEALGGNPWTSAATLLMMGVSYE
ncbi:MAG: hypothetical protein ACPGFA_10695 [Pikeienuella sp.]